MNANDYDDHEKNYYADDINEAHNQDDYDINIILYISENQSQYRQCKFTFEFNNLLHKHLRQSFTCLRKTSTNQKFMTLIIIKNDRNLQKFFANIIRKSFADISIKLFTNVLIKLFKESSSIAVIKRSFIISSISSLIESFIKHSRMNSDPNIEIGYDFKS